jgi:FAD/FMN-containing dehydrogenase
LTKRALDLGGTLSGEHGIGKVKAPLYREFYPPWLLAGMRALKQALDPQGILSPGNIFMPEE